MGRLRLLLHLDILVKQYQKTCTLDRLLKKGRVNVMSLTRHKTLVQRKCLGLKTCSKLPEKSYVATEFFFKHPFSYIKTSTFYYYFLETVIAAHGNNKSSTTQCQLVLNFRSKYDDQKYYNCSLHFR